MEMENLVHMILNLPGIASIVSSGVNVSGPSAYFQPERGGVSLWLGLYNHPPCSPTGDPNANQIPQLGKDIFLCILHRFLPLSFGCRSARQSHLSDDIHPGYCLDIFPLQRTQCNRERRSSFRTADQSVTSISTNF